MANLRIVFVDDEPNVLNGLRRMLHRYRDEWEMEFCCSAREALDAIEKQPFDVIITDMRMPEITGADLLREIHEKYPATVRIVLSGYCNQDLILQSVGFAHQYLAKPCSAEDLNSAIHRSVKLRRLLANTEMHERISKIKSLPTPPEIYQKLVQTINAEEPSMKLVAEIIAEDVGLTTKLLQIINSAFFSLPTQVNDSLHAVNMLGLDNIQALVISTGVFNELDIKPVGGISTTQLRKHGLSVGHLARDIAKSWGLTKQICEDANLAGMLHDVGKLVEIAYFPEQMKKVIDAAAEGNESLTAVESRILGAHHGEIGAYLLSLWGLPDPIIEAVAFHHAPQAPAGCEPCVLAAVHVANALTRDEKPGDSIDHEYLRTIGVEVDLDALAALITCETD